MCIRFVLSLVVSVAYVEAFALNKRQQVLTPEHFFRKFSPEDFPTLSFAETQCLSSKGRKGLCTGFPDCEGNDAIREGICSEGFGTCCVSLLGSSDSSELDQKPVVSESGSFFSNPDFPEATLQAESWVKVRIPLDVCQLRLDFESLDLPKDTVFKVKLNGNVIAPILAGNNSGQHLIVSVEDVTFRPSYVELSVSGPIVLSTWNVRLQNIYCFSSEIAPAGCAQYFTHPTGRVRSLSVYSVSSTPYAACLRPPNPTANLLSLRTLSLDSDCRSFMQVPAGMALNGQNIPTKVCPRDKLHLTYKVFGPLVLYMITGSDQKGVDVQYLLQTP